MIYLLTIVNAIILGIVAYYFYSFRKAVEASGVKQIDEYLHELEGSVSQLTEQFERSSTKISKDLLRKTTELQALIGETDAKLNQAARLRADHPGETLSLTQPTAKPQSGASFVPAALGARRMSASELLASKVPEPPSSNGRNGGPPVPATPRPGMSGPLSPVPASQPAGQVTPGAFPADRPANGASNGRNGAGPGPGLSKGMSESGSPVLPNRVAPGGDSRPNGSNGGQPNEKYRLIFLLASEGMDSASIAKHTNLTRGEVEMLLDLRRQGKI